MDFAIYFNQLRSQVIELHAQRRECISGIQTLHIDIQLKLCYYYLLKYNCPKSYSENDKLIIAQFEFDGDSFSVPEQYIRHKTCGCVENPDLDESIKSMLQLIRSSKTVDSTEFTDNEVAGTVDVVPHQEEEEIQQGVEEANPVDDQSDEPPQEISLNEEDCISQNQVAEPDEPPEEISPREEDIVFQKNRTLVAVQCELADELNDSSRAIRDSIGEDPFTNYVTQITHEHGQLKPLVMVGINPVYAMNRQLNTLQCINCTPREGFQDLLIQGHIANTYIEVDELGIHINDPWRAMTGYELSKTLDRLTSVDYSRHKDYIIQRFLTIKSTRIKHPTPSCICSETYLKYCRSRSRNVTVGVPAPSAFALLMV